MADSSATPWEQLFQPTAGSAGATMVRLRLVRRYGEPLLLLPMETELAKIALTLYPAQTSKARGARWLLQVGLGLSPSLVAESVTLAVDAASPFSKFLTQVAETKSLPRFAMLLGNPRAPGRRFVILLFDDGARPTALVKAGVGAQAIQLIEAELNFLKSQPAERLHAPQVRSECSASDLRAFAMEYAPGATAGSDESSHVASLLNGWVRTDETVRFGELPTAQRLQAAVAGDGKWSKVIDELAEVRLHPAIHHGDFAPWNVRVDERGNWRVLDWERGEAAGPPAWDWFHWVVQHAVLVRRVPTDEVAWHLEELLRTQEFQHYARLAGMAGHERQLLTAYLLYCARVIRQADGLPAIESLLIFLTEHRGCSCHGR